MVSNLGIFASNDLPKPRTLGIYKVPAQGWFAMIYTTSYGPYPTAAAATSAVEQLEKTTTPGLFGSWLAAAWVIGRMVAATVVFMAGLAALVWLLCAATLRQ